MHRKISSILAAGALVVALAAPSQVQAQVAAGGTTKFTLAGGGFIGPDFASLNNIFGISYFGSGGFEFGGDIVLTLSKSPSFGEEESSLDASGFGFGRVAYNFIGESTFVPFVTVGIGVPLEESSLDYLLDLGVGFKKFVSENISFDAMANYQGQQTASSEFSEGGFDFADGLSLFYGLSIYVGG